jgi:hypothetical protein
LKNKGKVSRKGAKEPRGIKNFLSAFAPLREIYFSIKKPAYLDAGFKND